MCVSRLRHDSTHGHARARERDKCGHHRANARTNTRTQRQARTHTASHACASKSAPVVARAAACCRQPRTRSPPRTQSPRLARMVDALALQRSSALPVRPLPK
eukprot:6186405-Pleurochrysis_carterae.AAC.1